MSLNANISDTPFDQRSLRLPDEGVLNCHTHTDIATLWLNRPSGPIQWKVGDNWDFRFWPLQWSSIVMSKIQIFKLSLIVFDKIDLFRKYIMLVLSYSICGWNFSSFVWLFPQKWLLNCNSNEFCLVMELTHEEGASNSAIPSIFLSKSSGRNGLIVGAKLGT